MFLFVCSYLKIRSVISVLKVTLKRLSVCIRFKNRIFSTFSALTSLEKSLILIFPYQTLDFCTMAPLDLDWMDPTQNKKGGPMNVKVPNIQDLLDRDPYLKNHEREIRRR